MFDLENKICEWKLMIAESSSITQKNAMELESHLRDSIGDLVETGLSENEAFLIASLRLGAPDKLSTEFYKVNGRCVWKKRILWMLFGFVGGGALATSFSGLAAIIAGTTAALFGLSAFATSVVSFVVMANCWTILFSMLWRSGRRVQEVAMNGAVSIRWLAALVALGVFGYGLNIAGAILNHRTLVIVEYGTFIYWASIGGFAIKVCVAMACLAMIVAFDESKDEETELAR